MRRAVLLLFILIISCCILQPSTATGQSREAQFRTELASDPENPSLLYNLACVVSLDGRADEALSLLRQSILAGFTHYDHLLNNDPDLTLLREQPAFESTIRQYIEERRDLLRSQLDSDPYRAPEIHFELATIAAEARDTSGVMLSLHAAFDAGFKDFFKLWNSASFNPYWRHQPFRDIADSAYDVMYAWRGTDEQKVFGLMTLWAEAKQNFAFFDQVPDLDWDAACQAAVPAILAAESELDYYYILQELAAKLQDGHTSVFLPNALRREFENLPLETEIIEGKLLARFVGTTDEFKTAGLRPGMEITAIDGRPALDVVDEMVTRRYCYGRPAGTHTIGMMKLFEGPANEPITLSWRDAGGKEHTQSFTRGLMQSDSTQFMFSTWTEKPFAPFRQPAEGIVYCNLTTFNSRETVDEFRAVFDTLDLANVKGLILDVRYNGGGNSSYGFNIISHFIDHPIQSARWRSRKYIPTHRAWGYKEGWFDGGLMSEIQPAENKHFTGPLVVLIGPRTFSAAEDFVVPLDYSDRAILVGDSTAGSTGQPLQVLLPGGGTFRVCTKRDTYPDSTEFVGVGIAPDILVRPTQQDILDGRDPELEKAVAIIQSKI